MIIRRILASFLVFLFVIVSIPNFFIYSISRSYLDTDFYKREDLRSGVYDFVVDKTVSILQDNSEMMKGYFSPAELKIQIEKVFTEKVFTGILDDFAVQLDKYKQNTGSSVVLSLRVLRDNLLTVSNNLAYIVYQNLPSCASDAEPMKMGGKKAPSCVDRSVSYEDVVRPIISDFETTIYNNIPEEMANFDKVIPLQALVQAENLRNISFLILLVILVLIVLVIFSSTSVIVAYIGNGFFLSGLVGYAVGSSLMMGLGGLKEQLEDVRSQQFLYFLFNFLTEEIKRLSLLFLLVGVALIMIKFVLNRTIELRK